MPVLDLSIFLAPETWISLVTLLFLELILGVDNLVFITITTDRLESTKRHMGRRLGLLGALLMRVLFLCFASYLVAMSAPLFTLSIFGWTHGFSVRDLVLLIGGAYLVYKGIVELRAMMRPDDPAAGPETSHASGAITLPAAVGTIMVMDLVFSIDSVITAVGLAEHLIVMIIAVMVAVFLMIAFIDPISDFIGRNPGMRILALAFIVAIGALLVLDGAGIHSGVIVLDMQMEKLMVYFAMAAGVILELLKIRYSSRNV